jgi:hypothetical protein
MCNQYLIAALEINHTRVVHHHRVRVHRIIIVVHVFIVLHYVDHGFRDKVIQ